MIKISASLSQKRPLPGVDYSSCQIGAAMEIEISDADGPEAVRERIQQLHQLLNASINQQFAEAAQAGGNGNNGQRAIVRRAQSSTAVRSGDDGNNGRRSHGTGATQAQQRAVFAISKSLGLEVADFLADYGVADVRDLTVKQCSQLIDDLKSRQAQQ